jgi:hypothetical protein
MSQQSKSPKSRTSRKAQLASLEELIPWAENKIKETRTSQQRLDVIASVVLGLYEEVDKLAKKAAAEQATELLIAEVNEAIKEVLALGPNDTPLQRIKPFVPAGDNPEYRDVLLVLRLLRQGIERLTEVLESDQSTVRAQLAEMRGLKLTIEWLSDGEEEITPDELKEHSCDLPAKWFIGHYSERYFDPTTLEGLDLFAYFGKE